MYSVLKALNNNVLLARGPDGREAILVGKGLGFGRPQGETVSLDNPTVEKIFTLKDGDLTQYRSLLERTRSEILGVTEEIIALAASRLGELHPSLHVALGDHIAFAIERLQAGLEIANPFSVEIRALFPEEYAVAREAARLIQERIGVGIPEGEAGFLTLHLHAGKGSGQVGRLVKLTTLTKTLLTEIESGLNVQLNESSLDYARLITHLRFAMERIEKGLPFRNPLLPGVKKEFPEACALAARLARLIESRLERPVPEDEVGYMAIHLERLRLQD